MYKENINIEAINELQKEIELFDIQLEDVHTFCITKDDIIVHNFLPIAIGISRALGEGFALNAGLCIAGLWLGTKSSNFNSKDNDNGGAQAPGKPTENDGFKPKKNWDGKKVKPPKGSGAGWPDEKGTVWIPTGPNGHGGPYWDVQHPDGTYDNVVPGGRIRGEK